jgi:Glycine rich protein
VGGALDSSQSQSLFSTACASRAGVKKLTIVAGDVFHTPTSHTITFEYNGNTNFGTNGSPQSWTVPSGVTSITVNAIGAAGMMCCGGTGGLGGEASGTVSVFPGEVLSIEVGGQPIAGSGGGYNGGGAGFTDGGGGSDVRVPPYGLNDRVVVGGGGGGSGSEYNGSATVTCAGGSGGWPQGSSPSCFGGDPYAGGPGTQGSGGAGGSGVPSGSAGTFGSGANGSGGSFQGAGGGGGYYGGGSGGGDEDFPSFGEDGPGGGGSSFFVGGCTTATCPSGVNTGNGVVTVTYIA